MLEDNVCTRTVAEDLCIGCGVCAGICPKNNLVMMESSQGGYVPSSGGHCLDNCVECLKVCPFQDHEFNEDSLGENIFGGVPEIHRLPETGFYLSTYAGHVADPDHRWNGASGGMATWFLETLLRKNIVDQVCCVTSHPEANRLFQFATFTDPEEIRRSAKSVYYPIELSGALRHIRKNKGTFALIGLPCFIKAVRLAAYRSTKLRSRIAVLAGLTCGQLKTKFFAELVIRQMGLDPVKVSHLCFRDKTNATRADNFSISARSNEKIKFTNWFGVPSSAWMLGMFKPRPCTICDDVYAELADITFMDAWLPEYAHDKAGTSIVITRSGLADRIIRENGILTGECVQEEIPVERVIESQAPVLKTKRDDLALRLWVESRAGRPVPRKRVAMTKPTFLDRLIIRNAEAIRKKSFSALEKQRKSNEPGVQILMKEMRKLLLVKKWLPRLKRKNFAAGLRRRLGVIVSGLSNSKNGREGADAGNSRGGR